MPFTTLSSLRWSWCVDTVVGQACQRVGCTVTVCGSHVMRVVKLVVESPATVGLGLRSQLFIMPLTTLSSLRWSWCVDTVVGQACQGSGCTVSVCGSHVKRAVKLVIESPATVGLCLRAQLFIMSLTTLPSRRWSIHHVSHNFHFALEVDTVVGQACQRVGCAVTVCGSHVKRVVKLVVESPATVGLGHCSQLFIMSLTTLPSLRWSLGVDSVVGQAC